MLTPEQRVRELCSQLLSAQADAEIQALLVELKAAIHQHCEDLKALAAVSIPKGDGSASRKHMPPRVAPDEGSRHCCQTLANKEWKA